MTWSPMGEGAGNQTGTVCFGSMRRLMLSTAILAVSLSTHPAAADDTTTKAASVSPDPDAWRFRVVLYGWAPSVAGSLTARGQTVDVNASFIQILQKSDSLIGYMGYFEANKGKVGFYTDTSGPSSASTSRRPPTATRLPG